MSLLFGTCNENQKQADLKNLLDMYKNQDLEKNLNREFTNDRFSMNNQNNNYLNYELTNDDGYENSMMRFRRNGITEVSLF